MREQLLYFLLLTGFLTGQESELTEIAKTAFSVRLTAAEEAGGEADPICPAPRTPSCCEPSDSCSSLERRFCNRCWTGPYFFGDWLFWQTRQEGMQYATQYVPSDGDMGSAKSIALDFGWNSGWRVGAGYDTPYDNWDVTFEFTRFCPEVKSHATRNTTSVIFPYLLFQGNPDATETIIVDEASGKWSISFNTWDLNFGRKIVPGEAFTLRPHIGIKGAQINQKATILYSGGPLVPLGQYEVLLQQYFNGFGLRGGFDTNWALGYGFSIFGNASGALLWGSYKSNQNQTLLDAPSIGYSGKTHTMKPMMEAMLGLSWDWRYYCDRFLVGIDAALETQYWWGQNVYERFTSSTVPTSVKTVYDLGFFGLTLGMRFGF